MRSLDVVIPTYNRGPSLCATVSAVLESKFESINRVGVFVVDDGSAVSAERVLAGITNPGRMSLQVLRQANSGPARARNSGFRAGDGDIVLFLDDDILPAPDLLIRHVLAHRERPASVIFGVCEWVPPESPGALFRLLQQLGGERASTDAVEYARVSIVASGQLSVERGCFPRSEGVYRDDLVTPAAEEYELSLRLRKRGIPVFRADNISARHDSSSALADVCGQQYKHGVGCGEAARRCPETLDLEPLARIIRMSQPQASDDTATALLKKLRAPACSTPARRIVLRAARVAETLAPDARALSPLYRLAIAQHFIAGVRDGLERFPAVSAS